MIIIKKRINALFYSSEKLGLLNYRYPPKTLENDYLYSQGKFPTKITAYDLPEYYKYIYMYRNYVYLKTTGVKYMIYKPNYFVDNHLFKDDFLYVSFDREIVPYTDGRWEHYTGYDVLLYGRSICKFLDYAEQYSNYDTSEIRKEIEKKIIWYMEHNPDHPELSNKMMPFSPKADILLHSLSRNDPPEIIDKQKEEILGFCKRYNLTPGDVYKSTTPAGLPAVAEELVNRKDRGEDIKIVLGVKYIKDTLDETMWNETERVFWGHDIALKLIYVRKEE